MKNPISSRFSSWYATKTTQNFLEAVYTKAKSYNPRQIICIDDPTSAHSKGIGRQSEFSNSNTRKHTGCIDSCRKPRLFILTNILLTELILGDQSFVAAPSIKNLKEQFDEHERILKGKTKQDADFLNTGSLL
jgi:hypothetical protein